MSLPWSKKFEPKTLGDVIGQDEAVLAIKGYVQGYRKQKKKALLLYGPTGTGKTSMVHALATDMDLELIEMNASDVRDADSINELIGGAIKQQSLFKKGKLILIDELDGVSGTADRGGIPALLQLIEESTYPVIMTAEDVYDQKFASVRKAALIVPVKPLNHTAMVQIIRRIAEKEKISFEDGSLEQLVRTAQGDARAAINDLQALAADKKLGKDDLAMLGNRTKTVSMPSALATVFKTQQPEIVRMAYENVQEDINKIMLWVDENLPKEYRGESLAKGFEMLSRSDVFLGRIRRWQHYRFYVYCYEALSTGISLAKTERNSSFVAYTPTSRILKLWIANQKNSKRKAVAEKIAPQLHMSKKRAVGMVPVLKTIARRHDIRKQFDFSDEEWQYIKA